MFNYGQAVVAQGDPLRGAGVIIELAVGDRFELVKVKWPEREAQTCHVDTLRPAEPARMIRDSDVRSESG